MKLKDLGEKVIVEQLISVFGIQDDDIYYDNKLNLLLKVDGFRLDYNAGEADLYDMGWKAVTSTISDLISRGGRPLELLVSFGIPKETDYSTFSDLIEGIRDAASYYNVRVVGGDTNEGNWIDVFGVAEPVCYRPPRKVDSKAVLIISEPLGYTETVFNTNKNKNTIFGQKLVHPIVRLDLLEFFSDFCEKIFYSTDVSDGLFITLYNISRRLKSRVVLENLPIANDVPVKQDEVPLEFMYRGGEDYVTLFVVNSSSADDAISLLEDLGFEPIKFGYVVPGQGVEYRGLEVRPKGWDSFRGWD